MYLLLATAGICVSYLFLYFFSPLFFERPVSRPRGRMLGSLFLLSLLSVGIFFATDAVGDLELGNRLLHLFGGGFLAVCMCWLVVRDADLPMTPLQFVVLAGLTATALGVCNEILEYFLQHYSSLSFAKTADDTWLDLISNLVGTVLGAVCFAPFIKKMPVD